jgi:hypothetical protein
MRGAQMFFLAALAGPLVASVASPALAASEPSTTHSSYLNAVSCPTTTICVAVGASETDHDGTSGQVTGGSFQALAVRTTDAGKTWVPIGLPTLGADLSGVSCWSANQCVAVGSTETISRGRWWAANAVVVRIGGATGSRVTTVPPGAHALDAVSCSSATACVAAGGALRLGTVVLQPEVMVSHNGGASWAHVSLPVAQGQLESVSCSATAHCVALGATSYTRSFGSTGSEDSSKPLGLSSSDGGLAWKAAAVPGGTGGPTAVGCQSASRCFAVGDSFNWCFCGTGTPGHFGETWTTDNGGATWAEHVLPTLGGYDVWYANAVSCWATGCAMAGTATTTKPGSLYYALFQPLSASGGPQGTPSTSASGLRPQYIYGLSCRDATNCIAVGQNWSKPASAAIETLASGHWATTFTSP